MQLLVYMEDDIATKNYVDTKSTGDSEAVQQALDAHIAKTTGIHGAVSTATASKLIIRDSAGRAQVASPSADSDIATKKYVDDIASGDAGAVQQALNTHVAKTTGVHGAVSTATANKIAIRDASGRMQVAAPSVANDVANKKYVDTLITNLKNVYYVDKNDNSNNKSWSGLSFNRNGDVELVLKSDFYQSVSGFLYFVTNDDFNLPSIGHVSGSANGERFITFPANQFFIQNWREQDVVTYLIFISD